MKKIAAIVLCIVIAFTFIACKEKSIKKPNDTPISYLESTEKATHGRIGEAEWQRIATFQQMSSVKYYSGVELGSLPKHETFNTKGLVVSPSPSIKDYIIKNAAKHEKTDFVILDHTSKKLQNNITAANFKYYEGTFIAGYLAGWLTETGRVGFIGTIESELYSEFELGFEKGVLYAGLELNRDIIAEILYSGSDTDEALGKIAADTLYTAGCDIIVNAAAQSGNGIITSAINSGRKVIGFFVNQNALAPGNVVASVVNRLDSAVSTVSDKYLKGEEIGGKSIEIGLAEGGFSIVSGALISDELRVNVEKIIERVILHEVTIKR